MVVHSLVKIYPLIILIGLIVSPLLSGNPHNKHQTRWLQEVADTPTLIVYHPGKRSTFPIALSSSPILCDYMDESADSQLQGIV